MTDTTSSETPTHKRNLSSLSDFTMLELDRDAYDHVEVIVTENPEEAPIIPMESLVLVAETEKVESKGTAILPDLIQDVNEFDFDDVEEGAFKAPNWGGKKHFSDYIKDGINYLVQKKGKPDVKNPVMLFESPSSSTTGTSFQNKHRFKFHDWPPPTSTKSKSVLGPCRYACMNGASYPVFLKDGSPPDGLMEHWRETIPDFVEPTFVDKIHEEDTVYAYLPVEAIKNHVNDPEVHYHLAGKDTIHLMTQKTTRLLPDTRTVRPCVVKTTHSMGSKGIFIIKNDEDDKEFEEFLLKSGNPTFVVTDFVDIARNVACHFYMHPSGSIVWFGSNENKRLPDGSFSTDSYLIMEHQQKLKEIQLPFVEEVVKYCHGLGYWGMCGIDILFDSQDRGYLVDINPRVTGSCPALMTLQKLKTKYNFTVGLFRRSDTNQYYGTPKQLMEEVLKYNKDNKGKSVIVIYSMYQPEGKDSTTVNIGCFGNSIENCKEVVHTFLQAKK